MLLLIIKNKTKEDKTQIMINNKFSKMCSINILLESNPEPSDIFTYSPTENFCSFNLKFSNVDIYFLSPIKSLGTSC